MALIEIMKTYSFPKAERLCGQQRIKQLYADGKRLVCFPLRVSYKITEVGDQQLEPPLAAVKVLLWAPKSLFRHAVDRNRIRRQMREAYRLSAQPLREVCQARGVQIEIAVNYMTKQQLPYTQIAAAMQKVLSLIGQRSEE